jgi:hypothetical protein
MAKMSRRQLRKFIVEQALASSIENSVSRQSKDAFDAMTGGLVSDTSIEITGTNGRKIKIPLGMPQPDSDDILGAMKVIEKILTGDQFKYSASGMAAVAYEMGKPLADMISRGEYQEAYDKFMSRYRNM